MKSRSVTAAVAVIIAATLLPACSSITPSVPACEVGTRLATVAQSVPSGSYIPCIRQLGEGWTAGELQVGRGSTRFTLLPDRAGGRTVHVAYHQACDTAGAVPTTPRAEGVRTLIDLRSIAPRYAGTLMDVFSGGCISYSFDFARGPHIALMEELQDTVGLFSRRQLRLGLKDQLGVELDS